jgi:type IV pilus assembly protein PilC
MPLFKYTVKNQYGETVRGRVEAQSKEQAAMVLRSRSLLVISIKPGEQGPLSFLEGAVNKVSFSDVVNFTRQLATMITAGLTLVEGLTILNQQSKDAMKKMLTELMREIEGGSPFAKALSLQGNTFSSVYIQLVKAGETAGVLDQVLERLADNLEKEKDFQAKTRGALIYPVIVIFAMIAVMIIMMVFVVPKLTQMYTDLGAKLPLVTQLLIDFSNLFTQFWWLMLILGVIGGFAFQSWVKTKKGRYSFDKFLLRIPILGVLRQKVVLTEFCRTMGLLLGAGISLLQGLEILIKAMDNVVYQEALTESHKEVEKGVPLSQAMSKYPVFPPILTQMIAVGEETGKLDEVLTKLSRYFEAESEHAVKNLTAAFEPMVMIVLGVGVGVLVVAIILPIYQITANF